MGRFRRRKALCRQQWGAEPAAAPAAAGSRAQSGTPPPRSGGGGVLSVLGLQVDFITIFVSPRNW